MSGIWDLLFGRGGADPTYTDEELMALNYSGGLYPKQYDYQNPPVAPTAYGDKTRDKLIGRFDEMPFNPKGWSDFLARNKQRMSPQDLTELIREDVLANRSAVIAESKKAADRGIRVGEAQRGTIAGESRSDAPAFWASVNKMAETNMPTYTHEQLHQYFQDRSKDEGLTDIQREYLMDGGYHHALIALLDKRLNNYEDKRIGYTYGPNDEKMLDYLERQAEKRLGAEMSKKNQGRISAR